MDRGVKVDVGFKIRGDEYECAVSTIEQHIFGLIDLGGEVGRSSVIGVVGHHQYSMSCFNGCVIGFID